MSGRNLSGGVLLLALLLTGCPRKSALWIETEATPNAPATSANAQSNGPWLPLDLRQIAAEIGCEAIPDFFERPGMIEPPYVYGVRPGQPERSAAFWCQRPGERQYMLVVMVDGEVADIVPWQAGYPGGLRVASVDDDARSRFVVHNDSLRTALVLPPGLMAIRSEYDGTVVYLVKHEGKWLVRMLH